MHRKNAVYKAGSYLAISVISLLIVPALVDTLGLELYGIIGLFNSFLYYISLVTIAFTSTFSRNLLFSMERKEKANIEYSTNIFSISILFVVVTPIVYFSIPNILMLLSIPDKYYNESRMLFLAVYISFVISVYASIYSSVYIIKNRLDLQSISNLISKIVLFILVMSYVVNSEVPVEIYSRSIFISALALILVNYVIFKSSFRSLRFRQKDVKLSSLKNNIRLSGWMFVNQIGSILMLQVPIYFVAVFIGYYSLGIYNIVLVIVTQIRLIGTLCSSIFEPTIFKLVAQGKRKEASQVINFASFVLGFVSSIIVGVFIGSNEYFFDVWLSSYDENIIKIAVFSTVYLPLSVISNPFWSYLIANKSLALNSIATIIFGVVNFIILAVIEYTIGLNIYTVIICSSLVLLAKNVIYLPLHMVRFGFGKRNFYSSVVSSLVVMGLVVLLTKLIFGFIEPSGLLMTLFSYSIVGVVTILSSILLWFMMPKNSLVKVTFGHFSKMKIH
ncbi:lipopolysaccharide biosynthesis protein [Vibrio breoganii]